MRSITKEVLVMIVEQHKKTGKTDMITVDFPFEQREERKAVAEELKRNGLISQADVFGKAGFRCNLSSKAINYFEVE